MSKPYCTQNNGDCSTCGLVNYGRDCANNPLWGGPREGAGRPSTGRKKVVFYITNEENAKLRKYLEELRGQ